MTSSAAAQPAAVEGLGVLPAIITSGALFLLNLCAAETLTSRRVRELLASDFGRRYATRTARTRGLAT